MEQSAEPSDPRDASDYRARHLSRLSLEQGLRYVADEERLASADLWIYAFHASKVLRRLREVAPDLLAAAELDVAAGVQEQ